MAVNLSLAALFEEAFGYQSTAFEPQLEKQPLVNREHAWGAKYWGEGKGGREYFMPVTLDAGVTNSRFLRSARGVYSLPYPIISASSSKVIIDTPMTERNGYVSEYINTGGWNINIKGFMIGEGQNFPEDDFELITKLYSLRIPLKINSVLTDLLLLSPDRKGSDEVIIRRMNLPEIKGVQHVRPYEMEMTSNEPFNLITK